MNKHTMGDLYQMQSLPLSIKIRMTQYRIREWVDHYGQDGVYVSFSGGKDSTVLLDIARKLYPRIGAVFVDTGLEYPEIREFVKQHENVEILKPKMNFRQVIIKYGYPFIGKEVAGCVYGAKRYVEKLMERECREDACGIVPNYSYMADLVGIDRRENRANELYQKLMRGEIPPADIKTPVRYLILQGKYPHKENGVETSEYSKMYNKERYRFFLEAPFEISERCCSVMKKSAYAWLRKEKGEDADDGTDGERKPSQDNELAEKRLQWFRYENADQQSYVILGGAGCSGIYPLPPPADCERLWGSPGRLWGTWK